MNDEKTYEPCNPEWGADDFLNADELTEYYANAGKKLQPIDAYEMLYKAYNDILAEFKEMLRGYPKEYRSYMEADEANEHSTHNDYFFNPLVTINIFEAYGQFYIGYSLFRGATYLTSKQWLDITRCIFKHTAKEHTVTDIEEWVHENQQHFNPYYDRLKTFETGEINYQPHYIEPLNDTIDPLLYPEGDLPY